MKKNIVIIVSAMNMGGAQRVVSILCNYWSQHGHNVTLISTFSGDNDKSVKPSTKALFIGLVEFAPEPYN